MPWGAAFERGQGVARGFGFGVDDVAVPGLHGLPDVYGAPEGDPLR